MAFFAPPVDFEAVAPPVGRFAPPAAFDPAVLRAAPAPVDFFAPVFFAPVDLDAAVDFVAPAFDAAAFVAVALFAPVVVLRAAVVERRLPVPELGSASPTVFAT